MKRDVLDRQEVAAQIANSGVNAVLVAPQLAVDAADSSAGKFWEPGAFGRFVGEAAEQLAKLHGDKRSVRTFASIPVVIVAYSGGYLPAAWCATRGGLKKRLKGVVLLDALYGELDKFAAWIENDRSAFFVSAYLDSTREKNAELAQILTAPQRRLYDRARQEARPKGTWSSSRAAAKRSNIATSSRTLGSSGRWRTCSKG